MLAALAGPLGYALGAAPARPHALVAPRGGAAAQMAVRAPLNSQLLVEIKKEPEVSEGGIFLPSAAAEMEADNRDSESGMQEFGLTERQPLRKATVVAIGEGRQADDCSRVPMGDIAVGQEVILSPYSGAIQADPKDSDSPLYLVDVSGLWATSGK